MVPQEPYKRRMYFAERRVRVKRALRDQIVRTGKINSAWVTVAINLLVLYDAHPKQLTEDIGDIIGISLYKDSLDNYR